MLRTPATTQRVTARATVTVPVAESRMSRCRLARAVLRLDVLDRRVVLDADLDLAEIVIGRRVARVHVPALASVDLAEQLSVCRCSFLGAVSHEARHRGRLIAGHDQREQKSARHRHSDRFEPSPTSMPTPNIAADSAASPAL